MKETRHSLSPEGRVLFCLLALAAACALALVPPARLSKASDADEAAVAVDFSHAGYGGGGAAVPDVRVVSRLRPAGGDETARIQSALDRAAALPLRDGFRGAVLLGPGRFRVAGQLRISADGVVLRGSGEGRTTLVAAGQGRRTLIELGGEESPEEGTAVRVADESVAAGSLWLTLETVEGLKAGDRVVVRRPSTKEWIEALGMNKAEGAFADQRTHWTPGSRDLVWDRAVAAVYAEMKKVKLDAPVTTALERRYGGGTVAKVVGGRAVRNVGVERLTLASESDASNPRDEEHSWIAVALDNAEDAWVRGVEARGFAGSAVRVGRRARSVTVEDCRSVRPVSEVGGYRRQSFLVEGQQVLVRRCRAEAGLNDFAVGFGAGGPNVFLECTAEGALGPSGSFESWASGVLYERVKIRGAGLRLTYDMERSQGGGWTAANSVAWNCEADSIEARGPEGAANVVRTSPEPLYEKQLASRLATAARSSDFILEFDTETRAKAQRRKDKEPRSSVRSQPLEIVNGRFVVGGRVVWGGMLNGAWWKGQVSPEVAAEAGGVSITRFVPGRTGPGLTEDLPQLAQRMIDGGMPFFNGGPGLWYERRRDAHAITPQPDSQVWAPFYEMPWARSGKGKAWDGLSLYDLTRFNPWYFARTREFAKLCERHGLVYYHNIYNTHNLLETAAHWVDFPWRPANNVNDTGLPEPPPLEARNTVHLANQVYDASDPRRRALHRAFILHNLDQLGDTPNVVFTVAFQFAGPLSFQQFFLDTVAEWEKRTGRRARVALITSKDITDAVLSDPARARLVSVIDTRYWQYMPDGKLWAPAGGQNLAFRELIAKEFRRSGDAPPPTTPEQIYRQVREYTDRFPDKAVVAWNGGAGPIPVLMAGGAQALMRNPAAGQSQGAQSDATPLDRVVHRHLAGALMRMRPRDNLFADAARTWALADEAGDGVLVYSLAGGDIKLAAPLPRKTYVGLWFDPRTGETRPLTPQASWGAGAAVPKPSGEDWLLLLWHHRSKLEF
ncbi:MAG TPA: DUF6298 domain-containing protein [Pyrinomonadaceae bacterium]|jgi:hypothetical protein|nr:DUF6298 domain-containing protein [Pyrinomonadaceae bacterium]